MKISETEIKGLNEFAVSQATKGHYVSSALTFHGLYFGTGEQVYLLQAAVNLRLAGEYAKADTLLVKFNNALAQVTKPAWRAGFVN